MTTAQRARYFSILWPAACRAQGWPVKDEAKRRECTFTATEQDSTTGLSQHEITALFAYLGHLAGDAQASDLWRRVGRVGAAAVNMQRQGEHLRDEAGYKAGGKLDFDRFRKFDDGEIAPEMNASEARKYQMTMQNRVRKSRLKRRTEITGRVGVPPAAKGILPDGPNNDAEPF